MNVYDNSRFVNNDVRKKCSLKLKLFPKFYAEF